MRETDRLSKEEKRKLKQQLVSWQTPVEMLSLISTERSGPKSEIFFTQSGLEFLRDAWIAATFGLRRKAARVRLIEEDWPDFSLEVDGGIEAFEAIEAGDPNRRRGDEYRLAEKRIKHDPVEKWVERADQAPDWIENAVRKKLGKAYTCGSSLVIYLQCEEYGILQVQVEGCFESSVLKALNDFEKNGEKNSFYEIWILWKDKIYCVWP